MPDAGFVNFEDPIPLYVSGFSPRSLGLAGEHGDGAVIASPRSGAAMQRVWDMIESGARGAGREIVRDAYYLTALTTIVLLEPAGPSKSRKAFFEALNPNMG